jgi:Flp pilus assembly protein TadD
VTNLVLHIANTVLVFCLLRSLTGAVWRSFLVAALFGIHPMHVESVAWVAERKDVLSGLFFLLTLLAYVRYAQANPTGKTRLNVWYGVALGLFILGLMSKSMLVTVPFVLLLLDWWPLRRLNADWTAGIGVMVEKIPFLLLSGIASGVTFFVQQQAGAVAKLAIYSMPVRAENALVSYLRYFGKTVFPTNLAVPYPFVFQWPGSVIALAVLFLLVMSGTALGLRRRHPFFFTSWFWFVGMLVPVIGLVQVGSQSMGDRYNYLPSIGVLVLLVWGGAIVMGAWIQLHRTLAISAGGVLLGLIALQTHSQTEYWRDDGTLFGHAQMVTKDNYTAYVNYGSWLAKKGDAPGALAQYNKAAALTPMDCTVLYDMGNGYANLGDWETAIKCYRNALSVKADQADILNNLGFALAATRQWEEAITNFELALRINPDYGDAHNNLASVLFRQGDYQGAATHFSAAARQMPENAQIQINLGDAWVRLGDPGQAASCYRRALEIKPDDERAQARLKALAEPALH